MPLARTAIAAALACCAICGPTLAAPRVMVLDAEVYDTSGEVPSPAHPERLAALTRTLREKLAESGRFELVAPPPPPAGELPPRIRTCNGCEVDLARAAGADLAVTSLVHKVSTLILSITIRVVEAASGKPYLTASADIRGDNDLSWRRGTEWLARNRLLVARYPGED